MRHTSGTRFVVFVAAMSSTALLAAIQGCSSSSSSTPPAVEAGSSGSSGSSGDPPPPPDPPPAPPPAPPPTDGGTDAKKDGDSGDAAVCLDDTGTIGACPGAGACTAQCAKITANFTKGVAKDAIANLTAVICNGDTADTVTANSLTKSCANATAGAFCDDLVAGGCSVVGFKAACVKVANGLSGTGNGVKNGAGGTSTLGRKDLVDCANGVTVDTCEHCLQFVEGKANP
jgi:hypothetical protein